MPVEENAMASPFIFQSGNTFYLWQKTEDVLLAERFLTNGKIVIAGRRLEQPTVGVYSSA